MELRQLEYLVAVAEEANFTKAAAKVHVSQPGVSAQIRQLERELGQTLLDRSGRTVRLTEVGAAVLPYARAALTAVAGARLAVDELIGLLHGRVAIGTVTSHNLDLPALLAEFHRRHPAVEITLTEGNSDHLVDALRAGHLDVALIALAAGTPPGIEIQVVADERIVVAAQHGGALAKRTTITLDALKDRTLISLPSGTGMRACLDDACAAAGFRPHIGFEAGDPNVLAELASHGLGLAILPEGLARTHPANLQVAAITRPALRGRLALAWRAQAPISPAARTFISHLRAATAKLSWAEPAP